MPILFFQFHHFVTFRYLQYSHAWHSIWVYMKIFFWPAISWRLHRVWLCLAKVKNQGLQYLWYFIHLFEKKNAWIMNFVGNLKFWFLPTISWSCTCHVCLYVCVCEFFSHVFDPVSSMSGHSTDFVFICFV